MLSKPVTEFSKEECVKWLKDLGLSVTGSKEELQLRIKKFEKYPKLIEKLKSKAAYHYKFPTSLDPVHIPPPSAKWKTDDSLYPKITMESFSKYIKNKREGSQGQQQKAYRILQSRKIVSVKCFAVNDSQVFVKAMVKKSYGNQARPAVVLISNNFPEKAHCSCPVGLCGLCCHCLAVLLFLQHFHANDEKILELTCTEQLQKWHKRSKKGSIPMIPIKEIKLTSAKKNSARKIKAADSENSHFKRNIGAMIDNLNEKLNLEKDVNKHITYAFPRNDFSIKTQKNQLITIDDIISQEVIPVTIEKYVNIYNSKNPSSIVKIIEEQFKNGETEIKVDISFLEAPKYFGNNHFDVKQNTEEWQNLRKYKITGSRLPSLLGFYGRKKHDMTWDIVQNGTQEPNISHIKNIERGHFYEKEALKYFENLSKAKTAICGFFQHPTEKSFGASPDALGPNGLIIEIKTRAAGSTAALENLDKFANYFVQSQLQMECTDASFCFLVSYHPESKSGKIFLIKRDFVLMNIFIELCKLKLENKKVLTWEHNEISELQNIGKNLIGKYVDFENLSQLRKYVNKLCKSIPTAKLVDNFEIEFHKEPN